MNKSPILVIDDDQDDLYMINEVVDHLKIDRPVHFFSNGNELIDFLKTDDVSPFLILCDVNLPGEDGFDLKLRLSADKDIKYKSVPFIFWSTSASQSQIQHAYDLPAQGFFFKPSNFEDLCATFKTILDYWQKSQHPKDKL